MTVHAISLVRAAQPRRFALLTGLLLLLACTYFIYAPATTFGFVYDDIFQILQNPRIDSWHSLPSYFSQHFWAHVPGTPANLYRPLVLVWFLINKLAFSHEASGWHLATVLVHLLVTGLVFVLIHQLLRNVWPSFAAAALFALHPIHVEPVAWVSGVTEPLCAAWFVTALICYLKYREQPASKLLLFTSLGCFAGALLTKETAVALPFVLFTYELLKPAESWSEKLRQALGRSWWFFSALAAYLLLRFEVLHGLSHRVSTVSTMQAFLTLPSVICFYIRTSVWPAAMSPLYDVAYVHSPWSLGFLVPTGFLLVLATGLALQSHKSQAKIILLSIAWFVFTLAPALAAFIAAPKYESVADRYLYLPSVGICLLAACVIDTAAKRAWGRRLAYIAVVLALVAAALTVHRQIYVWQDNYSLFSRAVKIAPQNSSAAINLGVEEQKRGRYQQALLLAQGGLKLEPDSVNLLSLAGAAAFQLHRFDLAEHYYEHATHIDPRRADMYQCLAMIQIQLERYGDAETSLKQALTLNPQGVGLHYTLGKVLSWSNDWSSAREQFKMELALDPQSSAAQAALTQATAHLQPVALRHP